MDSKDLRSIAGIAFDPELSARKIVALAGPRQAGKTTFARAWLARQGCPELYYNWDDPKVRLAWRGDPHFFETAARAVRNRQPWIVLDEIHKATRWRDLLKGWFDVFGQEFRFLVTGSARLDLLRRMGDALVGRYVLFHFFPLSFREFQDDVGASPPPAWAADPSRSGSCSVKFAWDAPVHADRFETYHRWGPFPEPLLSGSDRFRRRWAADYLSLVVREEARDLTRIAQLDRLETLVELLPGAVAAPISYSSLGRDLEMAHTTVKAWMEVLRRLYLLFPVRPYAKRIRRALRKAPKWYFLDWAHIPEGPVRLENLVASALWQVCHRWTDAGHGKFELRYLRTIDGREIDFVLLKDGRPAAAIEVKQDDLQPAPMLLRRREYLHEDVPGLQVVAAPGIARQTAGGVWIVSVDRFLQSIG